jgi:hypothetical protein
MNTKQILSMVLGLITIAGCRDNPSSPTSSDNLIINPSFEQNGNPSLTGWTYTFYDTSSRFSSDVPVNGGLYSVSLTNLWGPPSPLQQAFPLSQGVYRYRLSAWSKAVPKNALQASGWMNIIHKTPDTLLVRKLISFGDSVWTEHSMLDTISAKEGDSIIVSLYAGHSQWSDGTTLFDLVEFIKLE